MIKSLFISSGFINSKSLTGNGYIIASPYKLLASKYTVYVLSDSLLLLLMYSLLSITYLVETELIPPLIFY